MRNLIFRFTSISLLTAIGLTGCASRGSEFLGRWINTKNSTDTFQVVRNGDGYLIVTENPKAEVGAIYKDGVLEGKGLFLSVDLTYVKRTDTIFAPGFLGQSEYKRQK